ncbi:hypothetical protein PAA8504_03395 [Palleronia abyssalis]|uniref:Uncharacterized protein n=1 Tax=Palleronia abyssalis TaxID=1501240 RepID=A0A2R8BZH0_9RHOB|nr:hypothetical protein PAA8504_03395 [Palleronia abyssalis]
MIAQTLSAGTASTAQSAVADAGSVSKAGNKKQMLLHPHCSRMASPALTPAAPPLIPAGRLLT